MTGQPLDEEGMLAQSARVHNLQRVMSRMFGFGLRKDDMPPMRAVGPVTAEEYESRAKRYDKQLEELAGFKTKGKSTADKLAAIREYRMAQYNSVVDAAYDKRGWTRNGVPKIERLKELGIDMPRLVEIVKDDQE